MISADCLVFPAPTFETNSRVSRKIVYLPKNGDSSHYYHEKMIEDQFVKCTPSARTCVSDQPRSNDKKNLFCQKSSGCQDGCNYIPCVFLPGRISQEQLILYFHSNAEDITTAYDFVRSINNHTGQSVLVVQYPGYSFYKTQQEDNQVDKASQIENDALQVMQYLRKIGFCIRNITVMGRSIGSGPAVFLSSIYNFRGLVLLSPFLSISEAVKDLYGSVCGGLIKERFNNSKRASYVLSPVLIIHGKKDTMISYKHSVELCQKFKGYSSLKIIQEMTHSRFRCYEDVIKNLHNFYKATSI